LKLFTKFISSAVMVVVLSGMVAGTANAAPVPGASDQGAARPPSASASHPDTCILGYVWREAVANDHVCVIPERRDQAWDDNAHAGERKDPNGPWGPDTCVQGYVWREAVPSDHVCVVPVRRDQAKEDNAQAGGRLVRDHIVIPARINFDNGVPVGGWANLTIYPNGNYNFSGHFHDSGATSYNVGLVMAVRNPATNTVFTFSDTGHVAGTFEPGSRDHDFNQSGNNPAIQSAWNDLMEYGYGWGWNSRASWDLMGMLNQIKTYIGYVQTVVQVVGWIA